MLDLLRVYICGTLASFVDPYSCAVRRFFFHVSPCHIPPPISQEYYTLYRLCNNLPVISILFALIQNVCAFSPCNIQNKRGLMFCKRKDRSYSTATDTAMPIAANSAHRYLNTYGTATTSRSPPFDVDPKKLAEGTETRMSPETVELSLFPWARACRASWSSSSATARQTRQYSPPGPVGFAALSAPSTVDPRPTLSYPREIMLPHVLQTHAVE
jgi:hypothetical protein